MMVHSRGFEATLGVQVYAVDDPTPQGAFMTFQVAPIGGITAVEAMRIDSTGFIGLGTTTPHYKLDLQGGTH